MRKDENIDVYVCSTLGEYRDLCLKIGGSDCEAVHFLNEKIKEQGEGAEVMAAHSQMAYLLLPMVLRKKDNERE
jgi:hypothetical protein